MQEPIVMKNTPNWILPSTNYQVQFVFAWIKIEEIFQQSASKTSGLGSIKGITFGLDKRSPCGQNKKKLSYVTLHANFLEKGGY
jgi:hypothetical protein